MAHGSNMKQETGKPRGRCSIGFPTNQLMAIVLTAVFVAVGVSITVDPGHFADSSKEEGPDTPASSQMLKDNFTFAASPNPVYLGDKVTFWANASSWDGTELTFTILYDSLLPDGDDEDEDEDPNPASPVTVNVTGNPGKVVQNFTYNALGNFTSTQTGLSYYYVQLNINDGQSTPFSSWDLWIKVFVKVNSAPQFVYRQPTVYADAGEVVNLMYKVIDPDGDSVDVFWEFGDGTYATNSTNGSFEDRHVNQTHVWDPYVEPGAGGYRIAYKLNVTVTDEFENRATANATIYIDVPANKVPKIALTASSTRVEPGQTVTLIANATDVEGDPLTWTFDYADNTTEVVHTDETEPGTLVWCNMTHVFDEVGNYTVQMNVSDALGDNQVFPHNVSDTVTIVVAENRVPAVKTSIDYTPGSLIINATIGYLDVYLSVEAMDLDGDVLTVSWYLDNATVPLLNVSAGGKIQYEFVQILTITEARMYNVSVVVTDGWEGHNVTVSRTLNATSDNMPPRLVQFDFSYEAGGTALPNELIEFFLTISDREHDVIEIVIDFGDESPVIYVNLTEYEGRNTSYAFAHAYQYPGAYEIILWFSDNQIGIFQESHTRTVTVKINVEEPYVEQAVVWNWWDYTSLGALLAIPPLLVLRMYVLKRRRVRLEREGMTLEEARMKSDEKLLQRLIEGG